MSDDKKQRLKDMADAPEKEAPDMLGEMGAPEVETAVQLPQPCPVVPLGIIGKQLVFFDRSKQVVIDSTKCDKGDMVLWFGNNYLEKHFMNTTKSQDRWNQRAAQFALVEDCQHKGIFNPQGKVLGRGAHRPRADEDALVLHCGRFVLIGHKGSSKLERHLPGKVRLGDKDVFFPAADALPPPADQSATRSEGKELLGHLQAWNFHDEGASFLLLGFVLQGYFCGALSWRSHAWLVAPTGSGKTELQKLIRALHDGWIVEAADATEAGVRSKLGNDTLPVSLDELEKHDDPDKVQKVMNLMKKSSSGDAILRGSADHKGQDFTAQSCFVASSVLHATMRGEDRNRIALLELLPLPERKKGADPFKAELARWRKLGRRMHRRAVEQFGRFEHTLALYKRMIADHGFDGRWQDTYGTLLACADLALHDFSPDDMVPEEEAEGMDRVFAMVAKVLPMMRLGKSEARTDTERAIIHLLSKALPGVAGKPPEPVGSWLSRAVEQVTVQDNPNTFASDGDMPNEMARERLKSNGLRVVSYQADEKGKMCIRDARVGEIAWKEDYLAIAYATNSTLQELWRGTEWAGDGYLQSLRKAGAGDRPCIGGKKVRFQKNARPDNALLVPLEVFQGDEG
jgi:hypothetical protein